MGCHGMVTAVRNLQTVKDQLTSNLQNEAAHFEYDSSYNGETEQVYGYGPSDSTSTADIPMFLMQGGGASDTCLVMEQRSNPPEAVNPKSEGTPTDASTGDFKKMLDHYLWLNNPQGNDPMAKEVVSLE